MRKSLLLIILVLAACSRPDITMVTSTESDPWVISTGAVVVSDTTPPDVEVQSSDSQQTIKGFGTCFNELGWVSLLRLSEQDRESIIQELFAPGSGANFTLCRMPVAANDFARKWYSYDERDGDFDMAGFSIANDLETLIPYIKNALKYNKHYAARSLLGDSEFASERWGMDLRGINNGLPPEREGREGTDMFIQEDEYFRAYALYFSKFISAYRERGIEIFMVMPQNEFNSAQVVPSCTWTAAGLARFTGKFLGPEMEKLGVSVMFGTMERPTEALVDTILNDPDCRNYVTGVGFQWAGKESIPGIHRRYPGLTLYQTEQECGNGKNDWQNCVYSWGLMKHYLTNGARILNPKGPFGNLLAFENTDGSMVLVLYNDTQSSQQVVVKLNGTCLSVPLAKDSFTTVHLKAMI